MIQGLYTAVGGMIPRMNQQDNVANNLANLNTSGYKKTNLFMRRLITAQYALDHALGNPRTEVPEEFMIDFKQGTFDRTDNPYDIALNGSGFLRVRDAAGDVKYTRNGRFFLDPDGTMITSSGMVLLNDRNDPISISGLNARIMPNGDIYDNGVLADTVGIADFAPADYQALRGIGGGMFVKPAAVAEQPPNPGTKMLQGFLEDSNVEPISTMVDMIEQFRMFELGQKSIQIQDQSLQRVVTEVGTVR